MPINSRAKGKRGELEAVKYLKSLGFSDARRTQQYNGLGKGDVMCAESLPRLHLEVKFGVVGLDLGTSLLADALAQAERDAPAGKTWAVLWKPKGARQWRLTAPLTSHYPTVATFAHDEHISHRLQVLG